MSEVNWGLIGVIISTIGIIIAIIIGYWQLKIKPRNINIHKQDVKTSIGNNVQTGSHSKVIIDKSTHIMTSNQKSKKDKISPKPQKLKEVTRPKRSEKREKDSNKKQVVYLINKSIIIKPNDRYIKEYELEKGEKITGIIIGNEKYPFNVFFFNEFEYAEYLKDTYYNGLIGEFDTNSFSFERKIDKFGIYYFVVDTTGYRVSREIDVKLRKINMT